MAITTTMTVAVGSVTAELDEAKISEWIETKLNNARNKFIQNVSRGGGVSAPGEYPITKSGRLVSSVDYQMNSPFEGQLESDVEYAVYLTLGTSKMAKRKMLAEAMEETFPEPPTVAELGEAIVKIETSQ